jgi:hypothetical protein
VLFYVFFVLLYVFLCFLCLFCVVIRIFVLFYVFLCCYTYFVLFYVFLCCYTYFCVVPCIVCFLSFSVLFVCICVLNYCHRVATQLRLNISYHIYHISSLKLRSSGFSDKSGTNHSFMPRNISEVLYLHISPFPFNPILNCFVRAEILRLKSLRFKWQGFSKRSITDDTTSCAYINFILILF